MSKQFNNILSNLERTIQNLETKDFEFVYSDTRTSVPANKQYSIYYLTNKQEVYYTGLSTSNFPRQLKRKLNNTTYGQYTNIKQNKREIYPEAYAPKIKQEDYTVGFIHRYFIQKANQPNSSIIEISEKDYNKTLTLFNKTKMLWLISGKKEDVILTNLSTLLKEQKNYKGISNAVYPLQYWKPEKNSKDDVQKKLSLLKKT